MTKTLVQPTSLQPAIELQSLSVSYGTFVAVHNVSFSIKQHSTVALLGTNGAGKTSIVEALLGLRPFSGNATIYGHNVTKGSAPYADRLGVMLQQGGLWMGAKPKEILHLYQQLYSNPMQLDDVIEPLGLQPILNKTIRGLSGGQAQRLNMALALIGQPDLVVLDEPTAAMDPQIRHEMWDWLTSFKTQRGMTMLLTTHNMPEVEALADTIIMLVDGTIAHQGSKTEMLDLADTYVEVHTPNPTVALQEISKLLTQTLGVTVVTAPNNQKGHAQFAGSSPSQLALDKQSAHPQHTTSVVTLSQHSKPNSAQEMYTIRCSSATVELAAIFSTLMSNYVAFTFACTGIQIHQPTIEEVFLSYNQ